MNQLCSRLYKVAVHPKRWQWKRRLFRSKRWKRSCWWRRKGLWRRWRWWTWSTWWLTPWCPLTRSWHTNPPRSRSSEKRKPWGQKSLSINYHLEAFYLWETWVPLQGIHRTKVRPGQSSFHSFSFTSNWWLINILYIFSSLCPKRKFLWSIFDISTFQRLHL